MTDKKTSPIETITEKTLWNSRFIIMIGVIGLLLGSIIIFLLGFAGTLHCIQDFISFAFGQHAGGHDLYQKIIIQIMTIIDDFLLGIVLLVFSLGIYDLFISAIDPAENAKDVRPDWLKFASLDELKSVLGKVVLMILTIHFLRYAIQTEYRSPTEILIFAGALMLAAAALRISQSKDFDLTKIKLKRPDNN